MADMPRDTFVSRGITYVLDCGSKDNLRSVTVGPVVKKAGTVLTKLGRIGSAVGVVVVGTIDIWVWPQKKCTQE